MSADNWIPFEQFWLSGQWLRSDDTPAGTTANLATLVESLRADDTPSGSSAEAGTRAEAGIAADTPTRTSSSAGSRTESSTGSEARSGSSSSTRTLGELWTHADAATGASSSSGTLSSPLIGTDSPSAVASSAGAITDLHVFADAPTGVSGGPWGAPLDTLAPGDDFAPSDASLQYALLESALAADAPTGAGRSIYTLTESGPALPPEPAPIESGSPVARTIYPPTRTRLRTPIGYYDEPVGVSRSVHSLTDSYAIAPPHERRAPLPRPIPADTNAAVAAFEAELTELLKLELV